MAINNLMKVTGDDILEKLMIIDGNSILNRAFYGLSGKQLLSTKDGLYTNAIFGFLNIMQKYLEEEKPQYMCIAFDLKAPTFRHEQYEGYKANRKGMPDELRVQFPVMKDVLDAMNIKRIEYEGFEADDIIGSISKCAQDSGLETVIVTGDRDAFQLVSSLVRVKMPSTRAGKTETTDYDYDKVKEKYQLDPLQLIDVKGLMGDASDNIPGVFGIGEKTAIDLIKSFGSIENLYENIEKVQKKGVKEKLILDREKAFISKTLATIERNMPKLCEFDELKVRDYDREKLLELFRKLEFKSFIQKFNLDRAEAIKEPIPNAISNKISLVMDLVEINYIKKKIYEKKEFTFYYFLDKRGHYISKLVAFCVCVGDETFYFDFVKNLDDKSFLVEFEDVLIEPSIKKYGHDTKNFILYLKEENISFSGLSFDTMIAAYIIDPTRNSYVFSDIAMEQLGLNIENIVDIIGKGKNFKPFSELDLESLMRISGMYCEVINLLMQKQHGIICENSQQRLYYDIELPLIEVLADMEFLGIKVNVDTLKEFEKELNQKLSIIETEIYRLAGEAFNINSPKQLGVILYEKLKLKASKKNKTGYSTDIDVLEQLLCEHEIIPNIIEYRQLMKLKTTYVEGLLGVINPRTGRIHSSFNQTITATGRLSSTEPNLQNIPIKLEMGRQIRKVFEAKNDEFILHDADYSQIELRILAHISNDENMINAFIHGEDIHTNTAVKVFGVQKEDITPIMRGRAKAVNFGIVYGISDFSLAKDLGITKKEAKTYIDEYLLNFHGVKNYMGRTVENGRSFGYVETLFNRRRYLPELTSKNYSIRSFGERVAMNAPIQGSAADIIKIAMIKVFNELKKSRLTARLVLQIHDELIIESHIKEKEMVAKILKSSMEEAAQLAVPLYVEVKEGYNWYQTK